MPTPYLVRRPPCLGLPCCRDHQRRPRRPRCRSAPLDSPFQVCSESLRPLHPPFPGQGPLAPFPHTSPSFFLPSLAPAPSLRVSPLPPSPHPHSLLSSLPISPSVAESPLPLQRTAEGGCCRLLDFCTRAGCAASAATAAAAAAAAGAATAAAAAAAAGGGRREPPAASGESPTGPCRGVGRGGFKSSYLGSVAKP